MIQNHVWCDLPQQEAFSLFSKKIFQRVATLSTSPCLQKSYLPYDLAILLWGIYPKEMKMGCWKDICILMFIAALLIIAKIWKQPKCPSVDEWIKKMWCGASLVAQWLRICLPMQGTRVRALVREDPTCRRATKPMHHNYWACALEPASHNYWSSRA